MHEHMGTKSVTWDQDTFTHSDNEWDQLSQLSVSPVIVDASPVKASRKLFWYRIQSPLNSMGIQRIKVILSVLVTLITLLLTVRIRRYGSRVMIQTVQHKTTHVGTFDRTVASYRDAGFESSPDRKDERWLIQLSNVSQTPYHESEIPFFFHIPRCGGGTIQHILGKCYGLTLANDLGSDRKSRNMPTLPSLEVFRSEDGIPFVNVDTYTAEGILDSKLKGLVESRISNVIMSPHLHPAARLFNDDTHGRCFALLRHPMERAVSMFHYLAIAHWDPAYDPSLAYISLDMYARSKRAEHNWMVRFLSNELEHDLNDTHLEMAKTILHDKCLVGLLSRIEESFQRFEKYFGWSGTPLSQEQVDCRNQLLHSHWPNRHTYPPVEEGSVVWDLLLKENTYDIMLYEYAVNLFDEQALLLNR
jgi:hypothetical protein